MHKTGALVHAIAKRDNYCVDEKEPPGDDAYGSAVDERRNEVTGALPLVERTLHHMQEFIDDRSTGTVTPVQLLDGRNHIGDIGLYMSATISRGCTISTLACCRNWSHETNATALASLLIKVILLLFATCTKPWLS